MRDASANKNAAPRPELPFYSAKAHLQEKVVEIATGYVFGSWMGSLLCLVGIVLGSCTTILLVRGFGSKLVCAFYPKEKIDALPIIRDPAKRNLLTFILLSIPNDSLRSALFLNERLPFAAVMTTTRRRA